VKLTKITPSLAIAGLLAVLGGIALAAQDRYSLQVPGGLAFSEFRGYEDWQTIAVVTTVTSSQRSSAIPR
jgi:hypothetical protein